MSTISNNTQHVKKIFRWVKKNFGWIFKKMDGSLRNIINVS